MVYTLAIVKSELYGNGYLKYYGYYGLWNANCLFYIIKWKCKCVEKLALLMLMLDVGDGNSRNFHKHL